jgi:1,4-dihydroxy-2-naphthoyl-CoA hydrolase
MTPLEKIQSMKLPFAELKGVTFGAAATVINLPDDTKGTTTIESKTNFIGGAMEGTTVVATATPIHRGRRTQVWQTRLETEGKLVAIVTQTQMVL